MPEVGLSREILMTNPRCASRKLHWNTISSLSRNRRGTQIKSTLPLELERSGSSGKRETNLPRLGTTQRRTVKSSRQFDGVLVSENANRLLELLDLKRLL